MLQLLFNTDKNDRLSSLQCREKQSYIEMIGLKAGFSFLCTVTATWWLSLQVQSNPVNTDTKGAIESVHINSVCINQVIIII